MFYIKSQCPKEEVRKGRGRKDTLREQKGNGTVTMRWAGLKMSSQCIGV